MESFKNFGGLIQKLPFLFKKKSVNRFAVEHFPAYAPTGTDLEKHSEEFDKERINAWVIWRQGQGKIFELTGFHTSFSDN